MIDLNDSIIKILGIGPKAVKNFEKIGITKIRDLLFYFPRRWDDFSKISPIASARIGDFCCIRGRILAISKTKTWKKRLNITEALIQDESGSIKVIWFGQRYLDRILKKGDEIMLAGKVELSKYGVNITNPIWEKIKDKTLLHLGRIVPVYHQTKGISSRFLRAKIIFLFRLFKKGLLEINDWIPQNTRDEFGLLPLERAIFELHFPKNQKTLKAAQKRIAFDEIFLLQLRSEFFKKQLSDFGAPKIDFKKDLTQRFVRSLPFSLTNAQKKASWTILEDLGGRSPMNRLLSGDVGSGKTIVAAIAALNVIAAGHQVVFMAPTEILAQQHYQTFIKLFDNFDINIALLISSNFEMEIKNSKSPSTRLGMGEILNKPQTRNSKQKKNVLEKIKEGKINLIIGTHALIQKGVEFKKVGLVICDEQHRFGVKQRQALRIKKKIMPHFLSLTATPIPRTLSLAFFGDLDLSIIKELPQGRQKVVTKIVPSSKRPLAYDFIRKQISFGRQAFVICPLIKEDEGMVITGRQKADWEKKSVEAEYKKLSKEIFPDLRVAPLHGKMKSDLKKKIMADFGSNKINILVATSLVEVGIDIPNATVMMIEGAERFGLAQLHQLRGRVGRGDHQSFCLLFSESENPLVLKRLKALVESNDGFSLAQKDLEIRGPGEIFGTKQWGNPDMAFDFLLDSELIEKAQKAAKKIIEQDPGLEIYKEIREKLQDFGSHLALE